MGDQCRRFYSTGKYRQLLSSVIAHSMSRVIVKAVKLHALVLVLSIIGCQNASDLLPNHELVYLESYHCWPYDVATYSTGPLSLDTVLTSYPLPSACDEADPIQMKWMKFNALEDDIREGLIAMIEKCDDEPVLTARSFNDKDLYYSGCYHLILDGNGSEGASYGKLAFFHPGEQKLYVFEDIGH
jgi:hypothetical protein